MSKFTLFAATAAFAALLGACAHAGMPRPLAGGPSDPHADEAPVSRLAATLSIDEPAIAVPTSSGGMPSHHHGGGAMDGMPGMEGMPGMQKTPAPSPSPTPKGTPR